MSSTAITTPGAIAVAPPSPLQAVGFTTADSLEFTLRVAKLLSSSNLVPREYQGSLPNTAIALNMASRIGADPLQVMQSLVVIHGRPSWSAQFLIACFNQCGRYSSIRYRMTGERGKDSFGCIAYANELATGDTIESSEITIGMAKAEGWYGRQGSKWQTLPQHMLMLRAAAWLVRTHAPELAMGLQTQEEVSDAIVLKRAPDGTFETPADYVTQHEAIMSMVEQPRAEHPPAPDPDGTDRHAEPDAATATLDDILEAVEGATDMSELTRIAAASKWLPVDEIETARAAWKEKAAQLRATGKGAEGQNHAA